MRLSIRQWQLLSASSFGIYAIGQQLEDRPEYTLEGTTLTLKFKNADEFRNYTRRALAVVASRLVAFVVVEQNDKEVRCRSLFNQTQSLDIGDAVAELMMNKDL